MRVVVRIGDGGVDHGDLALDQFDHQALRLGEVGAVDVLAVHGPAVRVGDRVVEPQAADHRLLLPQLRLDAVNDLEQEADAVLEGSAVLPFAGVAGEDFVDEVAVAGLDVHGVEADLERQRRGPDVLFLELVEVVVGQDRPVGREFLPLVPVGIALGDQRVRRSLRLGVASGVGQLGHEDRVVVRAVRPARHFAGPLDQAGEPGLALPVQPELAGVRAPLRGHGDRLRPDQTGAAGGESRVAPKRQEARPAVRVAVAPLHRVDRQRVGGGQRADLHRLRQDGEVFARLQLDVQRRGQLVQVRQAGDRLQFDHDAVSDSTLNAGSAPTRRK